MSATVIPIAATARTRPAVSAPGSFAPGMSRPTARSRNIATTAPRPRFIAPVSGARSTASPESLAEVIPHAERVCHDGEGGVHRAARGEEARVHDIEVVDLVGSAVRVEGRRSRIAAEPDRPVLVGHSRQGNALPEVEIPGEQSLVALVAVDATARLGLHGLLELVREPGVALLVVRLIAEHDAAGA